MEIKTLPLGGIKRLLRFAINSGLGLAADFTVLYLLSIMSPMPGWLDNIVSSVIATTIVYFLVTRNTWEVPQSWVTYFIFILWYAFMIGAGSTAIFLLQEEANVPVLLGKIFTVPFSFIANYYFNRILFSSRLVRR